MGPEKVACCNCEVTIVPAKCLHIRCEECQKDGLDVKLCARCFRMGAECGPHKRGHAYAVVDRKGPSLFRTKFDKHWGWKEDLKLIKAAHKYKLGNWDEIASDLDSDKTREDSKKHFDRCFIRGAFGRYAFGINRWPYIDDRTVSEISLPHADADLTGHGHAMAISSFQYIVEFFRNWEKPVDFSNPNWFAEFEDELLKYKSQYNTPPSLSPVRNSDIDDQYSFEQQDSTFMITPPLSPVSVDFYRADDRGGRKRLLSLSDFDESDEERTSNNSDGSGGYEYKAELTHYFDRRSSNRETRSCGLQGVEDDGSDLDYEKKKPILRLKRVEKKWRPKKERNRSFLKEAYKGKLTIKINDDVIERLRELHPEQYYTNVPLLPFGAEERAKLKDDDLQLLAYMPEREDFEWEFNNDAERLISRITMHSGNDTDEDGAFESAVKLAKVEKYNRTLKLRRAKKATIREFELVNKFFDKIKKLEETRRNVIYSQQNSVLARRQERFHSLMKKTYQVMKGPELEQLLDAVTGYIRLNEKIMNLESLKADGIKDLKGRSKVICDRWKGKRKRRPVYSSDMQRKAHLRWKRFKRWTMQQATEYGSVESDA